MNKFEVNKEVVFSTAHISKEMADRLDNGLEFPHEKTDYGFRIYISRAPVAEIVNLYPKELQKMVAKAVELGCKWLVLDCDGPTYEGFEQFNW